MFLRLNYLRVSVGSNVFHLFVAASLVLVSVSLAQAQGGINYTGNGGRNTISGRIFFPSGRRTDTPGIKVKLENMSSGDLITFADVNGSFSFRGLTAGSYTIVIEPGNEYEIVRESVYIDDPGSSSMRGKTSVASTPRIIQVPIYLMMKRGKMDGRAGVVDAALAGVPSTARDLYNKALQSVRRGDPESAIEELNQAIIAYPAFALAYNELGVQYLKLGHIDRAAQMLRSAVKLRPDAFHPHLNYAIALLNQRNFTEAEIQLRQALTINNASAIAHMYLGIVLLNLSKDEKTRQFDPVRYAEAQKELEAAVSFGSDEVAMAHRYLGGIYWSKREYKKAADELETYLRLSPKAQDAERTQAAIKELRSKQ